MLRIIIEFDGRDGSSPRIEVGDDSGEAATRTEPLSAGPAPDFAPATEILPVEDSFAAGPSAGSDDGVEADTAATSGLAAAGAAAIGAHAPESDDRASGEAKRK